MSPFTAVCWLLVCCLVVALIACGLLMVVINQRDDIRILREEAQHLLDVTAGARSDRERLVDMQAENNRLLDEIHNLEYRHEVLIARFVPDDLSREDLS